MSTPPGTEVETVTCSFCENEYAEEAAKCPVCYTPKPTATPPGTRKRRKAAGPKLLFPLAPKNAQGSPDRPPWYDNELPIRAVIEARLEAQGFRHDDKFECCYCRTPYDPAVLEIEHVAPYTAIVKTAFSMSDQVIVANDVANLTYAGGTKACGCNQSKKHKPLAEYLSAARIDFDDWMELHPEFGWMRQGETNNLVYIPPWKTRTISRPADETSVNYKKILDLMKVMRTRDLRPRTIIGWELCYINRSKHVIGEIECVKKLLADANLQLHHVLLTSSRDSDGNLVIHQPLNIQEICHQTLQFVPLTERPKGYKRPKFEEKKADNN